MLAGDMPAIMPDPSIAIACIAGIGIRQADSAANGITNSVVASALDTSLDCHVMMFCNRILLSADDVFCD
jgi:hypothetical protein